MSQVVQVAGPRRPPRSRGPAFSGIVPGVGATAPVAFGATNVNRAPARRVGGQRRAQRKKKKSGGGRMTTGPDCWNAFAPQHLALPRAVGEYTVCRGTRQMSTTDKLIIIGTWQHNRDLAGGVNGYGRNWCDVVAIGCGDLSKKPAETAWSTYKMPMLSQGLGEHCQITPSACSVQIMNPNPLQTTEGILYIGKMNVQPAYAGDTVDDGNKIANNFVSYMAPRLCAAAKLALRGVQVDAHPLNMNRLADFTQIYRGFSGSDGTPGQSTWAENLVPVGFTPIVIYNPEGVKLNLLVCHEYRTRFELFNPACSSHKYHPPVSDSTWADMIKKAADLGSGVMDIADVVAKTGIALRS